MREIEIKFKVTSLNDIKSKLVELGCMLSEPIRQEDIVLDNRPKEIFTKSKEGDIILRIRKMKDRAIFTLKQQKSGEMDNIELETEISDPDSLQKALQLMNYFPAVEVKKERIKTSLNGFNLCLDIVEELGEFIEIEKVVEENSDPKLIRQEIFELAKIFGLTELDEETRGYDTQIFELHNK